MLLVTVLKLRLQERRPQAGGQAIRQGDVVPAQHHQVHGCEKFLQTEATVHRHVRQLPDLPQLSDGQARLLEELLGLVSRNDSVRIFLHGEELRGVVVELLLRDVPHVFAVIVVVIAPVGPG